MTSHNSNLRAVAIVCAAYLAFSIADVFSKMLGQEYNVHQILTYTATIGMLISGIWVWKSLGWAGMIPAEKRMWHVIRAFCVACIPISVIKGLQYLPLADYYGISFTAPFMVLVLSALFLKEKVGLWRWLCVVAGFGGVLVIAGPNFDEFGMGVFFALCAALFVSLSIITVRKIGPHAPKPYYIFYPFCATWLLNVIALVAIGEYHAPPAGDLWQFGALIVFVMAGQLGFAIGHSKASEAAVTAPFLYTQVIWGTLFGWLIFHDIPTATTWIGLTIVIGAGLYSVWREYRFHHAIRLTRDF